MPNRCYNLNAATREQLDAIDMGRKASMTRTRKRCWLGTLPAPRNWETGEERIRTRWDRLKWWLGSLPGLDASMCSDDSVYLFWRGF